MVRLHTPDTYEPAIDAGDDRDLIAMMNEARDPEELQRLTAMARQRIRGRSRQAHSGSRRTTARKTRGSRFPFGRTLSFRS